MLSGSGMVAGSDCAWKLCTAAWHTTVVRSLLYTCTEQGAAQKYTAWRCKGAVTECYASKGAEHERERQTRCIPLERSLLECMQALLWSAPCNRRLT